MALRVPDVDRLEAMLFDEQSLGLLPEREDTTPAEIEDAFEKGGLTSLLAEAELERRLTHIYRDARSSLQEGGANTLYLAVGFLVWTETATSTVERRAPLLLYPLTMTRRSLAEGTRGYRLQLADDDPQVNVTLLQKLEADYDIRIEGLSAPSGEEGAPAPTAQLDALRRAVRPLARWHVTDEVTLGLFSFTKYLMWVDLDRRRDVLARNDVVRHLLDTPETPFEADVEFPDPATFDRDQAVADTFLALDADSSQQSAIFAAARGHTFVLEGPPGTGKSQTIANLICHALATGKRVLFVSQKMAALDVVMRRLERIGLGPFCLELHSNRARKRLVLEQLRESLDVAGAEPPATWPAVADALSDARDAVNETRDALHELRTPGTSVHHALARVVALAHEPAVPLALGEAEGLDAETRVRLEADVKAAATVLDEVGDVREHPWRAAGLDAWRPQVAGRVDELAPRLEEGARAVESATADLAPELEVDPTACSRREIDALRRAAALAARTPSPPLPLLASGDLPGERRRIEHWVTLGRQIAEHRRDLLDAWDERLLTLDLPALERELARSRASVWPLSWWRARAPKRALRAVWRGGRLPATSALLAMLPRAARWRAREEELAAAAMEAQALLGGRWQGRNTDWDDCERVLAWVEAWRGARATLRGRARGTAEAFDARWLALASEGLEHRALERAVADLDATRAEATEAFRLDPLLAWGPDDEDAWAARLAATAAAWRTHKPQLRAWCAWVEARRRLEAGGLGPLVSSLETGRLGREDLGGAFEKGLWTWWLDVLFESDARLRPIRGARENARIATFRALDEDVLTTVQAVVRARLAQQLPRSRAAAASRSDSSEMGILHRELMRKRNMPLRRLFEKIPGVVSLLKPCLLMSPLSVAQYLSPDFPPFDLVVFDEASQIPPWDAVGAIARGTKLVVVGDSKQLPPTSFFQRDPDEEESEDEDDLQEMESILDECIAAGLPRLHLGWHYRSRHESLIAFSNARYYDDRLFTFPSSWREAADLGVSLCEVEEGVYDRSGTRTNRAEAEALVRELVARLGSGEGERLTFGVVTFSMAQQSLVEDLLEAARRTDPTLDAYFDDARAEPVFVKNLENVQGDERDVILLSVCYGPDANGRVALNFGPLNREGGERRLNVAVTRARRQVRVFATLRPEQIDLARTQSTGARHLKAFLEYAREGTGALGRGRDGPAPSPAERPFEHAVASALHARGWRTEEAVGCSSYRIDVGVGDPGDPARYLAAVETDGRMYARAATARDRHRTRPAVLGHLGWEHVRVWAVDWWQDPEGEADTLARRLEGLAAARRQAEAEADATGTAARGEATEEAPTEDEDGAADVAPAHSPGEATLGLALGAEPYRRASLRPYAGSARAFYDPAKTDLVVRRMQAVVDGEAPVAFELLARRVADAWGLKQITPRLLARVEDLVPRIQARRGEGLDAGVLWRPDQDPEGYDAFRVPADGGRPTRRARHIPATEAANAARALLKEHVGIAKDDLARETARLFGYRRITEKVARAMGAGVDQLLLRGDAVEVEGKLRPAP